MQDKLTIILPAYNEEKTILQILSELEKTKFPTKKEILIIDDFSKDKTKKIVSEYLKKNKEAKLICHEKNKGKGAAIRTGLKEAKGTIIAIQDADLEYNPNDLAKLVETLIKQKIPAIYGSRFLEKQQKGKITFYLGNKLLSLITSALYGQKITDMETCYKVIRKTTLKNIELKSNSFDIEPEITSKILKQGYKIKELPISYNPRTETQGKKIKVGDGFIALKCLIKYRFAD